MEKIYDRKPDGVESYCINQVKIYLTMNMINKGIPYFPTPANFFDEEVMELLEAKFGVLASYIVMRLLCKIYKEGYYISWGKEQNLIFVRKVGGGIKEDMMEKIVDLLLEKGFFHKETYEKYGILTSEQIQRVWFEATTRRKIDFSQLPYLLETKKKKGMQKEELNAENADIFETQEEVSQENADISRQTKLKETKLNHEEEETNVVSIEIPGYAYNLATHNIAGLMESLDNHKVTDPKRNRRFSGYRTMAGKAPRCGNCSPIQPGAKSEHRGNISLQR